MADRTSWKPWVNKKRLEQREAEVQELQYRLAQQQRSDAKRRDHERQLQRQLTMEQQERARQEDERRETERALQHEKEERARLDSERKEKQRLEEERIERLKCERRDRERKKRDNERIKLQTVSPDTLRSLRELIRERYELDVEIWSLRNVRRPDRWIVEKKMDKADAILLKIFSIVHAWDGTEGSWTATEWSQAKQVQGRVLAEGKRWWAGNAPWDD